MKFYWKNYHLETISTLNCLAENIQNKNYFADITILSFIVNNNKLMFNIFSDRALVKFQ